MELRKNPLTKRFGTNLEKNANSWQYSSLMQPLAALDRSEALALRGLLFDLDDTFIDEGKITEAAYSSLFRLREAGLELYIVTGRPLGWVRLFTRVFPID